MRENSDEKNLVVISGKTEVEPKKAAYSTVTSPIRKMLLDFSKEKAKDKPKIWDLFKN